MGSRYGSQSLFACLKPSAEVPKTGIMSALSYSWNVRGTLNGDFMSASGTTAVNEGVGEVHGTAGEGAPFNHSTWIWGGMGHYGLAFLQGGHKVNPTEKYPYHMTRHWWGEDGAHIWSSHTISGAEGAWAGDIACVAEYFVPGGAILGGYVRGQYPSHWVATKKRQGGRCPRHCHLEARKRRHLHRPCPRVHEVLGAMRHHQPPLLEARVPRGRVLPHPLVPQGEGRRRSQLELRHQPCREIYLRLGAVRQPRKQVHRRRRLRLRLRISPAPLGQGRQGLGRARSPQSQLGPRLGRTRRSPLLHPLPQGSHQPIPPRLARGIHRQASLVGSGWCSLGHYPRSQIRRLSLPQENRPCR